MSFFKKFAVAGLLLTIATYVQGEDRLDMEGISIVGNSELPKALYIVPWKNPDDRASTGKPVNSLIDGMLVPLEREKFLRRLKYFNGAD
ncbi:MAG: hypothetical protein OQL06_13370 [Gammaproteobacteria bacterium]|nr:hypothetical protein [Gammaproteobacteria bacterium]